MIITDDSLKDLRVRAGNLASTTESLAALLEEEGINLKRKDEVAKLQTLRTAIIEHINKAKSEEKIAGYRHSEGKSIHHIAGSVAEIVGKISNDVRWKDMSKKLAELPPTGEPAFGTVMVCIGPGGVPDDVHVVSVSCLARDSLRNESEVIEEIQKTKNAMLTEKKFSEFMDGLAEDILKGRSSFPFRLQPTPQIQVSRRLRPGQ